MLENINERTFGIFICTFSSASTLELFYEVVMGGKPTTLSTIVVILIAIITGRLFFNEINSY